MKEKFPMFYIDLEQLWKEAVFVFDANVILDLLRIPAPESASLISILKALKEQNKIWIPYQVALEYHKNYRNVIVENNINSTNAYKTIKDTINKLISNINTNYKRGLPDVNIDNLIHRLNLTLKSIDKIFKTANNNKTDFESVIKKIDDIFSEVGDDFNINEKEKITKEADKRFKEFTPPGFEDNCKDTNKYGDVLLWFQIMNFSKDTDKNIIFVTRDSKKDWFTKTENGKQIISPRWELLNEFYQNTKHFIYIYQIDNFIKHYNSSDKIPTESKLSKEKEDSLLKFIKNPSLNMTRYPQFSSDLYTHKLELQRLNSKLLEREREKKRLFLKKKQNFSINNTNQIEQASLTIEQMKHIDEMKNWFLDNYEDPVDHCPYESREGGYIYIYGGPYEPYEEIYAEFGSIYSSYEINIAAEEIINETGTYEWSGKATDDFVR